MTLDARVETEAALASLAAAESQAASLETGLSLLDDKLDALLAEMERGEYGGNVDEIKALMSQVSAMEAEAKTSQQAVVESAEAEPDQEKPEESGTLSPQQSQRSEDERQKEKQEHDALLDMMG